MRFVSWGIVAACGFLLAGPAAKAAEIRIPDLPSPSYNWTGFYAGVYAGGGYAAWAADYCRNGACRHAEGQSGGFAAGVYGGYNFQFANRFLIGGEFDWGKSSSSRDELVFGDSALLSRFGVFGSARLRVGYAFDRLLAFGAVGVGVASIGNGYRYTVQKGCDTLQEMIWDEQVKAGMIAGGGIEYAFTKHFVGRGEYLYADYGSVTLSGRDRTRTEFRNEMHLVRVGASYRF
ncbi:MAG TPA: outer membrane beta-barrel protein [Bradyrhizobium sp.]